MEFCNLTGNQVTFFVGGVLRKVRSAGTGYYQDGILYVKLNGGLILEFEDLSYGDWVTLVTKEVKREVVANKTQGRFVVPVNEISPGVYTSIDWGIPQ